MACFSASFHFFVDFSTKNVAISEISYHELDDVISGNISYK